MAQPVRRGRSQGKTEPAASSHTLDCPDALEGDLIVILAGFREQNAQLTIDPRLTVAAEVVPGDAGGNEPVAIVAWAWAEEDAPSFTVLSDVDTLASFVSIAYSPAEIDRSEPVRGTARAEGTTSSPTPLNPDVSDWAQIEPGGDVPVAAGAAVYPRGQAGVPTPGSTWDQDAGGNLAGTGDFTGLRQRFGFTTPTRESGTVTLNAASTSSSAPATAVGYVVQGLTPPIAGYTYAQRDGELVLDVLDATHNAPTSWRWLLDGLEVASEPDPVLTFTTPGTYTLELEAENATGADTFSGPVTVAQLPPAAAWVHASRPGQLAVELLDRSRRASSLAWWIDGALESTEPRYVHTFTTAGPHTVRLVAQNAAGTDELERTIDVQLGEEPPERTDGLRAAVELLVGAEWLPITCDVIEASWPWGAGSDLGVLTQAEASQLSLRLADPARDYDPGNTSSPYYGQLELAAELRIVLEGESAWSGRVTDVAHDLTIATIQAADVIAQLSSIDLDTAGPFPVVAESVSDRIDGLLNVAGWPSSRRDIEPDPTRLQAQDLADVNVWEHVLDVVKSSLGRLSVGQDGAVRYRRRTSAWAPGEPVLTLGCDQPGDPADAGISGMQLAGATAAMRNRLGVGIVGGEITTRQDAESIERYGLRTEVVSDLLLTSTGERDTWASFVLARHARPSYGGRAITFTVGPAIASRIVGAQLGELWRVRDEHHGPLIDLVGRLIRLEYTLSADLLSLRAQLQSDLALAEGELTYTIDTAADWSTAAELQNARTDRDVLELGSA